MKRNAKGAYSTICSTEFHGYDRSAVRTLRLPPAPETRPHKNHGYLYTSPTPTNTTPSLSLSLSNRFDPVKNAHANSNMRKGRHDPSHDDGEEELGTDFRG